MKKSIGKIRIYILTSQNPIIFTPLEDWLKNQNRKTIYHFVYLVRLKALQYGKVNIETRKPIVRSQKDVRKKRIA
jgi:hypothetical protein